MATADEEYGLRMKELEDAVSELKEQVFRSKAKLTLLTEQVQGGSGAGSRIVITHKNLMGPNFLLVEVNYFLDGTPLWQEFDDAGTKLTAMKEHPLWDGNIVEGSHTLTVELRYRGDGSGVFQYLSGYTWKLKDALTFTAESGKLVQIDVVGFEAGNFTTEMSERPKLRFDKNVQTEGVKKPESPK
ncbi:MAG: dihydrolipoamide acetyltransferase [Deltaproteobacteria bacterium]|nr:dihydrolipoamide acetyltransferase [Deltaproteobacteria bacterium]